MGTKNKFKEIKELSREEARQALLGCTLTPSFPIEHKKENDEDKEVNN